MKYAQRYTCLSRYDRSEPDYKDSGEKAKKKLAKLPIRKLSRVGQLLMAQGQAAIARGDLETARHSFYAVA